mgnify:CR=1 FL=1
MLTSASNYYEDVTQAEAEAFYGKIPQQIASPGVGDELTIVFPAIPLAYTDEISLGIDPFSCVVDHQSILIRHGDGDIASPLHISMALKAKLFIRILGLI